MLEFKNSAPNKQSRTSDSKSAGTTPASKQQRLMTSALALLLGTLVFVLYRDRDFWFPDAQETEEQSEPSSVSAATTSLPDRPVTLKKGAKPHSRSVSPTEPERPITPGTTITRTVLPPLEVEVMAGSDHRTLHPGSNSIQVDMDRGATLPLIASKPVPVDASETPAAITSRAAERVQVSPDTANVVSHSVTPGYPTLARQMKVQGSVILRALIGRDGLIQDLHVVSGPPILANAAQEAVRQWHFKPHYLGSDPVETEAKITVNFTISTN